MHVDKNADGHVVDQNVDQVSREIAYVPLGEGIKSKRSSCMQFFFFFEWVQDMLTWGQEDMEILVMYFWGPKVLDPSSCFQKTRIFGFWLMFSEDQRFGILAHVFQRTKGFWILAHVFRGPMIFGLWLMFSKDQRFGILAHVVRRPRVSGSWLMFSNDLGFFYFGSCLQRTKGLGYWLMFLEDQGLWILAHVFKDLWFLDLGSCFQRTKGFLGFGSCFQRTKGSRS